MNTSSKELQLWLEHRSGREIQGSLLSRAETRALELNKTDPQFLETKGKSEINCFVGFIDLAGFTSHVHGQSNDHIYQYVSPFLKAIVDAVSSADGLVDKTIGDEVMFAFPDMSEEGAFPAKFNFTKFINSLLSIQSNLGKSYRFRFGISYGKLLLQSVDGTNYQEWTLFGEEVAIAKRVMGHEFLKNPQPIAGALARPSHVGESFDLPFNFLQVHEDWWIYKTMTPEVFPGVGELRWLLLTPASTHDSV